MKFLDITGLQAFISKLYNLFATKQILSDYQTETDWYIIDVDYSEIIGDFNKKEIIK